MDDAIASTLETKELVTTLLANVIIPFFLVSLSRTFGAFFHFHGCALSDGPQPFAGMYMFGTHAVKLRTFGGVSAGAGVAPCISS